MKKPIPLLLALALCLFLCACGKSETVKAFEELTGNIGEVTLESESAIALAEEAYDKLTEEEKGQVEETAALLSESRAAYDQLVLEAEQEAKLAGVVDLIDAIGAVTLDSDAAITEAEQAYDALTEEEKDAIRESGETLETSRTSYEQLVMEQNASNVVDSIDAIGEITLDSEASIEAARKAYDALKPGEKELVSNIDVLQAAEAQVQTLVQAEKQRLLAEYEPKFDKTVDKVEGITWYFHKDMPEYIDTRCYITSMVAVRGNDVWMCHRYNYAGDSWVFFESVIFSIDGDRREKHFSYYDIIRQAGYGSVGEFHDEPLNINLSPDASDIQLIADIADSTETIMRFKGDEFSYDYIVTDTDKQMLRDAIALYRALLP